jgi:hypothetical protein
MHKRSMEIFIGICRLYFMPVFLFTPPVFTLGVRSFNEPF